ncbi:type II secretion system F family protein [Vibrio sp. VB16]|uniref:type II secretion system F family protein n=1 Tax=Vibrio sp. VB16 TaxID=2785746 RepID=UPI0018A087F4|nr:type II secretion system F family protein [Vibrio sp. VB16]UGA54215.1 type II secretion system F family protein [Vibrio sp. VB16]
MELLENKQFYLVLSIWFLAVGIATIAYVLYEQVKRSNQLSKIGLSEKEHKTEKRKKGLESLGKKISNLVAASDTEIENKFIAAGVYNTRLAYLFVPIKYLLLVVGVALAITLGLHFQLEPSRYLVWSLIWGVVAIIVPDGYLAIRTNNIKRKLSSQLPYLLDMMGVCVQTGMTIESSMTYLAKEMVGFDIDMAHMLKRTNERAQIVGLEKAIEELYIRIPTAEFRSFVMTLSQSLRYGSSIYEVLTRLATDIREIQMLGLEEKIGKLSAKMSVPLILFIMFPIVILTAAPGVMRMM